MNDKTSGEERRPDLVRNYRPVAIRSVIAAHAMIAKPRPDANVEPLAPAAGFTLPAGFHNPAGD
ncbi:hypothetical protein AB3G45_20425 [Shinella sp. S4-D37]|uniref:hypothetical protein n=1 Tax=Shinella sp. S4-D37 TaxID=3161999 RepID=UPI003466FE8F